jgi:RNA polymerase sigma factor (sigma-70 family)
MPAEVPVAAMDAAAVIERYAAGVVGRIARRMAQPPHAEYDDLYQEGCLALLDAARRYVPGKVKFSTWASWQIQFRLLDYLRCTSPLSRAHFASIKRGAARPVVILNFGDATPRFNDGARDDRSLGTKVADQLIDRVTPPAWEQLQREQEIDLLVRMAGYRHEAALRMRLDGLPLAEIGMHLGISASRVSQMIKEVVAELRRVAPARRGDFAFAERSTG